MKKVVIVAIPFIFFFHLLSKGHVAAWFLLSALWTIISILLFAIRDEHSEWEIDYGYYIDGQFKRAVSTNEKVSVFYENPKMSGHFTVVGVNSKTVYRDYTQEAADYENKRLYDEGKNYYWKEYSIPTLMGYKKSLWVTVERSTGKPFRAYEMPRRDCYIEYLEDPSTTGLKAVVTNRKYISREEMEKSYSVKMCGTGTMSNRNMYAKHPLYEKWKNRKPA